MKNIKDQQAALREKLDVLDELKAGRTGPVRVLDELATLTPKRLWITKLDEKGGAATITGQAATIDDVSAFMTALKGEPALRRGRAQEDRRRHDPGSKTRARRLHPDRGHHLRPEEARARATPAATPR